MDFLAGFKPKGWSVLLLLASLVALLFVGAALATVEMTAEGQGMLRAPKGLRPVASVLGGSLAEVLVQSGDQVQPGQVVARLEATELRANLVTRERELETTRTEVTVPSGPIIASSGTTAVSPASRSSSMPVSKGTAQTFIAARILSETMLTVKTPLVRILRDVSLKARS